MIFLFIWLSLGLIAAIWNICITKPGALGNLPAIFGFPFVVALGGLSLFCVVGKWLEDRT
jgi:hypothetical protein